jgi:antitoxin component YwqK of YwqJK toxin-antitoxin module/peroxiredoxin
MAKCHQSKLMKKSTLLLFAVPFVLLGSCKFLASQLIDFQEFWPNGLPKTKGKLLGEMQSGEWTLSYESGQPLAKGTYKDDRQIGAWVYYYEDGTEKRSGFYDENGLRTGAWTYTYEDSAPQSKGSYFQDFEDGLWTFYGKDGSVVREGQFDAGKQSGLWRFNYAGGTPRAEGVYYRGSRIGQWQLWTENGASRIQNFGSKAGVQVVRQVWPGTTVLQRVGALANGNASGRWTSWHANGKIRLCCGMASGSPNGVFEAREEDGSVMAQGRFEGGVVASGECVANGVSRVLAIGALPPPSISLESWPSMATIASASPESKLSLFVSEHKMEVGTTPYVAPVLLESEVSPDKPAPEPEAIVADIDGAGMREPAVAQPQLTVKDKKNLPKMVDQYTNGVRKSNSTGEIYAPTPGGPRPSTGTGRRKNLENKPMPFDIMKGVDGNDVNLKDYHGKQRVMIVVLRGFLGKVCMYCVAQTKALAKARAKLEAANVEVLVIYPGAREREESFRQLYEEEFGEGPPPYRVFYDQDLELVTKLGIEGDLASPTTIIIDKTGTVQYAYVGEHRADRPATNTLIKLIEGM